MMELAEEINQLIESISQSELKRNPRLKAKIKVLLGKLESCRMRYQKKGTAIDLSKFLSKKILIG